MIDPRIQAVYARWHSQEVATRGVIVHTIPMCPRIYDVSGAACRKGIRQTAANLIETLQYSRQRECAGKIRIRAVSEDYTFIVFAGRSEVDG